MSLVEVWDYLLFLEEYLVEDYCPLHHQLAVYCFALDFGRLVWLSLVLAKYYQQWEFE